MSREIVGKGLRFSLRHAPCAHICRYCLISDSHKRSTLPFARFEQLVHRFHDWRQAERQDLEIGVFVGPSFDFDIDTLSGIARLRERRGVNSVFSISAGCASGAARSLQPGYRSVGPPALSASTSRSRVMATHTIAGTAAAVISSIRLRFYDWVANMA